MSSDLKKLIDDHQGGQLDLLRDYINPKLARVLKTIGFDPVYVRGSGAHLWDADGNDIAPGEAYQLVSVACDLRITQLVDQKVRVHVMIPKALLR